MPAYELIEDRNAVYTETNAVSMIVENCWNGGVVIGAPKPVAPKDIIGVTGRQTLNGKPIGEGKAEDPFATLAWLANLLAERGRDLKAGMVVITGSLDSDVFDLARRPCGVHGRGAGRAGSAEPRPPPLPGRAARGRGGRASPGRALVLGLFCDRPAAGLGWPRGSPPW